MQPSLNSYINSYGDSLIKTTGAHGANIASQRMDDLDMETLRYALGKAGRGEAERDEAALDLGCGFGTQGLRLAALGFRTLLIDQVPIQATVMRAAGLDQILPISYLMTDARQLTAADLPDQVTLCYSQRFVHYLRFAEARDLLGVIRSRMSVGAKLFLSASGLGSELGAGYPARDHDLDSRYSSLAPAMAQKHDIRAPVCLYTREDLAALGEATGFTPERVFSSPFGNQKGIFMAA